MSNIRYELLDTGPAAHGSPQLLYVTSAQYGPDWQGSMHAHTCTELFYCVRGIGEFRLTDRAQPVGSDDLIIVNPHVEHTETSFSSNPLEYIVLGVNGLDLQLAGEPSPFTVLNCRQQRSEICFTCASSCAKRKTRRGAGRRCASTCWMSFSSSCPARRRCAWRRPVRTGPIQNAQQRAGILTSILPSPFHWTCWLRWRM